MLSAAPTPPAGQQDRGEEPLDTAELVSDERLMWQWNRKDDCLHGRTAVIWFARAVIDDYRAASEATAAQQEPPRVTKGMVDVLAASLDELATVGERTKEISAKYGLPLPAAPANGEVKS